MAEVRRLFAQFMIVVLTAITSLSSDDEMDKFPDFYH